MPAEQASDGYLFDLYHRYIGKPADRADVYAGLGLFLSGIGLAVIGLVFFLWGTTFEARSPGYFAWVGPAYALAMSAPLVTMFGIVTLLPSERRVLYTSMGGVTITIAAIVGFLVVYPKDWNGYGNDYTVEVIVPYTVGLAFVTASTSAALIADYLTTTQQANVITTGTTGADWDESEISDAQIQRDIDDAMEDVELSRGGVEKTEHRRLRFSNDDFDDVTVDTDAGTTTTRSSGVDAQVASLNGLKGGETKTITSSATVDDQTAKLKALRKQKRAEELATADDDGSIATVTKPVSILIEQFRDLAKRN
ncbi:alkaline shock response membrane anchor protein AmaP [Natrinema gelatinilyticum]|uniref:alkaline shock response membrane anchor protein AmaP n=1 Tax=Natrinema gelatinilyticum TaxID=2961571 RepID=UPI0020C3A9DB|nr:alkaline shock response membrane anchor protein AmaP [Natrinema gelatinilyticum]